MLDNVALFVPLLLSSSSKALPRHRAADDPVRRVRGLQLRGLAYLSLSLSLYIHLFIYLSLSIYLYLSISLYYNIYIYIYRERESDTYVFIYIYIYIYTRGWQPVVPRFLAYSMMTKVLSPAREYIFRRTGALVQARTPFHNMA